MDNANAEQKTYYADTNLFIHLIKKKTKNPNHTTYNLHT